MEEKQAQSGSLKFPLLNDEYNEDKDIPTTPHSEESTATSRRPQRDQLAPSDSRTSEKATAVPPLRRRACWVLRIILTVGQLVWPVCVAYVVAQNHSASEGWDFCFFSLLGNSAMIAVLRYVAIRSKTETSGNVLGGLSFCDVLPTLVWLSLLSAVIPIVICLAFWGAHFSGCFLMGASYCGGAFKRREEEYFEALREREDEDIRLLEAQQNRLQHLEEAGSRGNDYSRLMLTNLICVLVVLPLISIILLLHYSLRSTTSFTPPETIIAKITQTQAAYVWEPYSPASR